MGTLTVEACCADDEDYIDMEVSSLYSSNFLCYSSISSPPQTREFEFQLVSTSVPHDTEATTSPADELFYKGKLLPLHLPPRLQMVRKLLRNSEEQQPFEDESASPLVNTSESCGVSTEINPDESLLQWSTAEMINATLDHNLPNKSWIKKLKQVKQYCLLSQKLKASKAYLKSLFMKPGCSGHNRSSSAQHKDCLNKCISRSPFGKYEKIERFKLVSSVDREIVEDGSIAIQRRSFSGAIHWHSCTTKSSSSCCSSSSSSSTSSGSSSFSKGIYDVELLKRSSSANSDIGSSIEGAIAHCKSSLSSSFVEA